VTLFLSFADFQWSVLQLFTPLEREVVEYRFNPQLVVPVSPPRTAYNASGGTTQSRTHLPRTPRGTQSTRISD